MKNNLREVAYKNLHSIRNGRRVISLSERSENESCRIHTRKMSIYKSKEVACFRQPLVDPVVHITKIYRSETREEKFYFRIKGVFHVINDSVTFEVHYSHSLFIDIVPKDMLL